MPKIEIQEIDETTPGVASESTDVVYIPGLVNTDQDSLYEDADRTDTEFTRGKYIGLEYRKPHLFTNVEDFVTLCGERPIKFDEDVKFNTKNFDVDSIPVEKILIKAGTSDPAYVMAKELLSAGLCVMYERINDDNGFGYEQKTDVTSIQPGDRYYFKNEDNEYVEYNTVKDTQPTEITNDTTVMILMDIETWWNTCGVGGTYDDIDTLISMMKAEYDSSTSSIALEIYRENKGKGTYDRVSLEDLQADDVIVDTMNNGKYSDVFNETRPYLKNYNGYVFKVGEVVKDCYLVCRPLDPTNCYIALDAPSIDSIYSEIADIFSTIDLSEDTILDKGNYSVKYLTSGGYPVYEYDSNSIVTAMLNMASNRGDCVALIDHTDYKARNINPAHPNSLYKSVETNADTIFKANGDYGAMFTPWATYNRLTNDGKDDGDTDVPYSKTSFRAPASFAYLMSLADSIKTNANWLAIAGATRGGVMNLSSGGMDTVISNGAADKMQPRDNISINAITNIKPYGYTIWGNRTLKKNAKNLVATSFLNIRNLVSDVKKTCYDTARSITFEQDTDILWINFKAEISKLLNRMVTGYGISGYKILRDTSHKKATEKGTICAKVILFPTYAVEDFYITIVLKDDEVTVE